MSEEERMADVRSKLFTLFDEGDEREREMEERNRLKNRVTGTFAIFNKNLMGDEEEQAAAMDARGSGRGQAPQASQEMARPVRRPRPQQQADMDEEERPQRRPRPAQRTSQQADMDEEQRPQRRPRPAQRTSQQQPDMAEEQRPQRRPRPAQRTLQQQPDMAEEQRPQRRPRPQQPDAAEQRTARRRPESADAMQQGGRSNRYSENTLERPAQERAGSERIEQAQRVKPVNPVRSKDSDIQSRQSRQTPPDTDRNRGRQYAPSSDPSFKLGDLFREEEPDIISQWERQDEEERRIKARRERRRAEAARRQRGENEDSKMKTAAALFVVREGFKNVFGKVGAPIVNNEERDMAEREAEEAIKALAMARDEEYISSLVGEPEQESEYSMPPRRRPRPTRQTMEMAAVEPQAVDRRRPPAKPAPEPERKAFSMAEPMVEPMAEPAEAEPEIMTEPERKAFSMAKPVLVESHDSAKETESEAPRRPLRHSSPHSLPALEENDYDDVNELTAIIDTLKNPPRPTRTTFAWIAGGAVGTVAVVLIAMMIAGGQAAELAASAF
jgi:hypothetical protein